MTTLNLTEYVLPAYWASALINGDTSGMSDEDYQDLVAWLEREKPGNCLDYRDDAGFRWRNDAGMLGGDCMTFVFHKAETS